MFTVCSGIRRVSWMSYAVILGLAGSNVHTVVFCRSAMFTYTNLLLATTHSHILFALRTRSLGCLSLTFRRATLSAPQPSYSEALSRLRFVPRTVQHVAVAIPTKLPCQRILGIEYENLIWCDFDRASSLICGNKMPTRCNRGFYCRSYCLQAIRSAIKTSVASSWHFISTYENLISHNLF